MTIQFISLTHKADTVIRLGNITGMSHICNSSVSSFCINTHLFSISCI